MADTTSARYGDHEEHFRSHYRNTYDEGESHVYGDYEPAYRSGFRYGTADEHADRSFDDLEPEMRRSYEREHGKGTWPKVKDAARHAFQRGRSRHPGKATSDKTKTRADKDVRPKSPSGSGQTASGGPGSAMREEEEKYRREGRDT